MEPKENIEEIWNKSLLDALDNISLEDTEELHDSLISLNKKNAIIFPKLIISLVISLFFILNAFVLFYIHYQYANIISIISFLIGTFSLYFHFYKLRMDYFITNITVNELKWDLQYILDKAGTSERYTKKGVSYKFEYFFYMNFIILANLLLLYQSMVNILNSNYILGIMFFAASFMLSQQITCRGIIKLKRLLSNDMGNKYKKGEN